MEIVFNSLLSFKLQVAEPLRAMVVGAPLEDARQLAQRYDRVRQEAEAQVNFKEEKCVHLKYSLSIHVLLSFHVNHSSQYANIFYY